MWTNDAYDRAFLGADDRAFLHEVAFEVIAAVEPAELGDFEALFGDYFVDAWPPRTVIRQHTPPAQKLLTPVAPAVIAAVLNLLVFEIHHSAQYDQADIIKLALKRVFRRHGAHPHERAEVRQPDRPLAEPELVVVAYLYTRPVVVSVPLSRIASVAYQAASVHGLDEARADALVPLTVARLILGSSAFRDVEDE